jgi:cell pole-organizing protein PopZ
MADKTNTSSLLEAIKNKLNKFDNKSKSENKDPVNYFSQDSKNNAIDGVFVDKTNIELIFDAEKKLDKAIKFDQKIKQKASDDYQKNLDLDIDDESGNVKNLGQKILIESKIKEIADELNLEEFEEDFEYQESQENQENDAQENNLEANKNLDPIDLELMELEKEVNRKNAHKTQEISDEKSNEKIEEDVNLKKYLDEKFEDEFNQIEEKIQNKNYDLPSANNEILDNNSVNFKSENDLQENENKVILNMTPAQDFLASMSSKTPNENDENVEEVAKTSENFIEKQEDKNQVAVNFDLYKEAPLNQDFLASMPNEIPSENIAEVAKNPENFIEKQEDKNQVFEEFIPKNTYEDNLKINKINEDSLFEKNINNVQQNNSKNLELNIKNNDEDKVVLEKINYNLIKEEAVYQASNSMRKLMEAKNLVNNVGKFSQDETLTKIAMNLMEPKLEKWLNENLPLLVENIVREEIQKIVPKN